MSTPPRIQNSPPASPAALARVTGPPGSCSDIALSAAPVSIGSAATCHIRLSGGPALAAILTFENGAVVFHNCATRQRQPLRHGSRLRMGHVTVEIALAAARPPSSPSGSVSVSPRRRLLPQLHGLIVLSLAFLVFGAFYGVRAFKHQPDPLLLGRDHAVVRAVSLVYSLYCLTVFLLWFRLSSKRAVAISLLVLGGLAAIGMMIWSCFLSDRLFTAVLPVWVGLAAAFSAAALAGLFIPPGRGLPSAATAARA